MVHDMSEQLHGWIGSPATATSLPALSKALLISLFVHAALLGVFWKIMSASPPPPRELRVELSTNAIPASAAAAAQVTPPPVPERAERKSAGRADRVPPRVQASNAQAIAPAPLAAGTPSSDPAVPAEVALEGEQQQAQANAPAVPIDLRVLDWLAQYRSYPLAARRAGIEGVVQLRVTLLPDGRLVDVRVEHSSGHALLDRAALDLLTRAARLPEEFGSTRTEQIELQLPIVYRMRT
jgi:protein TonB